MTIVSTEVWKNECQKFGPNLKNFSKIFSQFHENVEKNWQIGPKVLALSRFRISIENDGQHLPNLKCMSPAPPKRISRTKSIS